MWNILTIITLSVWLDCLLISMVWPPLNSNYELWIIRFKKKMKIPDPKTTAVLA